jgi:hypothetical protein
MRGRKICGPLSPWCTDSAVWHGGRKDAPALKAPLLRLLGVEFSTGPIQLPSFPFSSHEFSVVDMTDSQRLQHLSENSG